MAGFDFGGVGSFLGGAAQLGGALGLFGDGGAGARAQSAQNFAYQQMQMQEQFQREMAQQSIRYRVDDAKRAGISPLVALGAPTFSPNISATPMDVGGGGQSDFGIGTAIRNMGQGIHDIVGKSMTDADKINAMREQILFDQRVKSNDMDIQLKGASLAKMRGLSSVGQPGAGDVGFDSVKVVPDKVVSGRSNDQGITSGVHPDSQEQRGASGSKYLSPTDPAVINNPSITNPFMLRWMWDQFQRGVDRNVTNPLRSWMGLPEYKRQ